MHRVTRPRPLFSRAGIIGPEDPESLEAALKVTGVFEAVHIVPWGERGAGSGSVAADGGALHVAKMNPEERAQVMGNRKHRDGRTPPPPSLGTPQKREQTVRVNVVKNVAEYLVLPYS